MKNATTAAATVDNALHFLYCASIIVSGNDARNAYDAVEWYVRTGRASVAYEVALEALTKRRAVTIIEKMVAVGGSTDGLVETSKALLRV